MLYKILLAHRRTNQIENDREEYNSTLHPLYTAITVPHFSNVGLFFVSDNYAWNRTSHDVPSFF